MENLETSNLNAHSKNIKQEMQDIVAHLRRHISKVEEPQAKALFETSAEVINGLITAFDHYEKRSEEAWR